MSDIYVHLKAADEIFHQVSSAAIENINSHRNAYNLGAQGPDILFYHRIFPWTPSSPLKKIASIIHTQKTSDFFIKGFTMIKKEVDPVTKSFLTAYFYGFLTHYAIDTKTHPYIFYYSGHQGGYNHKYFECLLDTFMAKMTSNSFAPTHKLVKLTKVERKLIATFLNKLIEEVFDITAEISDLEESLNDMNQVLALLYDPFHLKKPLLRAIDKLSGSKGKIKTAIFPNFLNKSVDYLNLNHDIWYHPCAPHEKSENSFLDLIKHGETFGIELILQAEAYLISYDSKDAFKDVLKNLGYDTGLNCLSSTKMTKSNKIIQFK